MSLSLLTTNMQLVRVKGGPFCGSTDLPIKIIIQQAFDLVDVVGVVIKMTLDNVQ